MRMRFLLSGMLLSVLSASLATPSSAAPATSTPATGDTTPDPATIASARQLLDLVHVDRTLAMMFDHLKPLMVNSTVTALEANPATADMMKSMEASRPAARDRIVALFREEFDTAMASASTQIIDQTAREYAAVFTRAELDEIIAFYSSGAGRKVITMMPALQQKMSQYGQQAGQSVGQAAGEKAMKRAIEELLPKQKETKS